MKNFFAWMTGPSEGPSSKEVKLYTKLENKYGLVSGGCRRPDGQVDAGWATLRGKRPVNEDTVYCQFHPVPQDGEGQEEQHVGCFGVFDGHGGPCAASFVRDRLFESMRAHECFPANLMKALAQAYADTDEQYCELDGEQQRDDGCTAVTGVLLGRRLAVAHVGDSRAVMSVGSGAMALSRDHKPNREDERDRIEGAGGAVVWAGTWRVSGVLAVSRSFGNRMMKHLIIPHPEIREDSLNSRNQVLVLASDGLWDAMNNDEATRLALEQRRRGPEAAARALAAEAFQRGSQDNISCVVVFLSLDSSRSGSGCSTSRGDSAVVAAAAAAAPGGPA